MRKGIREDSVAALKKQVQELEFLVENQQDTIKAYQKLVKGLGAPKKPKTKAVGRKRK